MKHKGMEQSRGDYAFTHVGFKNWKDGTISSNASSERSFSALRKVKNYLRSTMTQDRLNHAMLLQCHKELKDDLNLVTVANQFVDLSSQSIRKVY